MNRLQKGFTLSSQSGGIGYVFAVIIMAIRENVSITNAFKREWEAYMAIANRTEEECIMKRW